MAVVLLVALAGWAYAIHQSATSPGQHDTVEVRIVDFAFEPATITVSPGTTVVWTNVGPTAHTTTSRQRLWDSGILQKGASYRFTFDKPGAYDYWCVLHPSMLGTVIVK